MRIKDIIKKVLRFLIYYFFCIRNNYIDYFNYKKLIVNFPIFSRRNEPGLIGNKCYGNLRAVKQALGKNFDKNCLIEHGLYFGEFVIENECKILGLNTIYTFGEYRLKALKYSGIKEIKNITIVSVGPYILHAKNFHNITRRKKIKRKYGKILLVFPYHTSPEFDTNYDIQVFIKEIDRIKNTYSYDSVFVSMFWLDIKNEKYREYKAQGYTIVCSGVRNDPYFLQRQRDLIELSDMTMSNDLGTHIGYCISLGKPHYLFSQKINVEKIKENISEYSDDKRVSKIKEERILFTEVFNSSEPIITLRQKQVVSYYWGEEK